MLEHVVCFLTCCFYGSPKATKRLPFFKIMVVNNTKVEKFHPKNTVFQKKIDGQRHIVCCHSIWSIFLYELIWSQLVGSFKEFWLAHGTCLSFHNFRVTNAPNQNPHPKHLQLFHWRSERHVQKVNQLEARPRCQILIINDICQVKIFNFSIFSHLKEKKKAKILTKRKSAEDPPEELLKFQNPYRP